MLWPPRLIQISQRWSACEQGKGKIQSGEGKGKKREGQERRGGLLSRSEGPHSWHGSALSVPLSVPAEPRTPPASDPGAIALALALQSGSQSRSGVVTTQARRCGQVLVFCESWPVWLFILSVFHLECATVYITDPLPSWLPVLRQCFPDITFSVSCAPSVILLPL